MTAEPSGVQIASFDRSADRLCADAAEARDFVDGHRSIRHGERQASGFNIARRSTVSGGRLRFVGEYIEALVGLQTVINSHDRRIVSELCCN
jgi:hypothetical protein